MQYLIARALMANHILAATPEGDGEPWYQPVGRTLCGLHWDSTNHEIVDLTKIDCMECTDRYTGQLT